MASPLLPLKNRGRRNSQALRAQSFKKSVPPLAVGTRDSRVSIADSAAVASLQLKPTQIESLLVVLAQWEKKINDEFGTSALMIRVSTSRKRMVIINDDPAAVSQLITNPFASDSLMRTRYTFKCKREFFMSACSNFHHEASNCVTKLCCMRRD